MSPIVPFLPRNNIRPEIKRNDNNNNNNNIYRILEDDFVLHADVFT